MHIVYRLALTKDKMQREMHIDKQPVEKLFATTPPTRTHTRSETSFCGCDAFPPPAQRRAFMSYSKLMCCAFLSF